MERQDTQETTEDPKVTALLAWGLAAITLATGKLHNLIPTQTFIWDSLFDSRIEGRKDNSICFAIC